MITTKHGKENHNGIALIKLPSSPSLRAVGEKGQQQQHSSSSRAYYNFVNSIKSLETRRTYEFIVKKYRQFHNLQTIDELVSLAIINKSNPAIIEDKIIDWLVSLRETITYGTRRTTLAALTTFYEINDINIRKKRIAKFLGQESTRKHVIFGRSKRS
jgi:hypothetical protein